MSKLVNEETISAYVDGELTSDEMHRIEIAISKDSALRGIRDRFIALKKTVKSSSRFVKQTVSLPAHFSSRIMASIDAAANIADSSRLGNSGNSGENQENENITLIVETESSQVETSQTESKQSQPANRFNAIFSVRTIIEIAVATAALILIV